MTKKRISIATRRLLRLQRSITNEKTTIVGKPNARRKAVTLPEVKFMKGQTDG